MTDSFPKLMTIERHILESQGLHPDATGRFTNLLYDIALCAKLIARETTRAGIADILGALESENVHGERQQKLDVYADRVIFRMNDHTGRVCVMASEEHEDLVPIPEPFPAGYYVLVYDPLDGSSISARTCQSGRFSVSTARSRRARVGGGWRTCFNLETGWSRQHT